MLTAKLLLIIVLSVSVNGADEGDDCSCNSSPGAQGECITWEERDTCDYGMATGCGCSGDVGLILSVYAKL
jgi:hypothetical protein